MRFDRYQIAKVPREVTPRRMAAARRAVARELAEIPLFPELARDSSAEERMERLQTESLEFRRRMRQDRAEAWRRARAAMRALPGVSAAGVAAYWARFRCPGSPEYLADIITQVRRGESAWRMLRRISGKAWNY